MILSVDFLLEVIKEDVFGAIIAFLILGLIIFLIYIISTQFPDSSGKIVQFDDVLDRLIKNGWNSARDHFEKAIDFFSENPFTDVENCIKDSVCTLEACLESVTKNSSSTDFKRMLSQLEGIGDKKIPPPIAQSMLKLYAYRGDAAGVAHANSKGSQVSEQEAELVLNLVASYVIYLSDIYGTISEQT